MPLLSGAHCFGQDEWLTDRQILEIRSAEVSFDAKLDALAKFGKDATIKRGEALCRSGRKPLAAGYNKANLIDILIIIGTTKSFPTSCMGDPNSD
ncbi:MAG: hypothetical protein IPO07_07415 [Haliscomenobacter sp.]|nr:hypothetical protein [Haliscomenobacter sp.]MBK9488625.1 hypothetical protein [Haliscomenobacter sp.]